MKHTEMINPDSFDLPPDYRERLFGVASVTEAWNPHESSHVAVERPFVSFEEYQSMIGESYLLEDYRSAFVLLQLAVKDAEYELLYSRVSK